MISEIRHDRYFECGRKFYCGGLPVAELHGSWFQMGRQYGTLLREELVRVLRFAEKNPAGFCRIGQRGGQHGITGRKRLDEFCCGIAETSGLTQEQLRIICSVEAIYNPHAAFNGGCRSSLAVWGNYTPDGNVLFGRNYDGLPDFEELLDTMTLAVFHPADGANSVAMVNWAGCLHLTTGMNENGLFLELNSGTFSDSGLETDRIRNRWPLWEFLLNSNDFPALQECFASFRSAGSCLIGAADSRKAELFEWNTRESCISIPHEDGLLAAIDHFTAPGRIHTPMTDSCDSASVVNSRDNLLKCAREYREQNRKIGLPEMLSILDRTVSEGGAKADGTLFQLLASPAEQTWHIKLKGRREWVQVPLMNLLKGKGDLA